MADDFEGFAGVPGEGFAFGFDGVDPGEELGGGGSAAGVGSGGA